MKITSQLQSNRTKILLIFIISTVLIGLLVLLQIWKGIPYSDLTRDITSIAKVPPYVGFFSQLGIIFWIATSTLCLFSASATAKKHNEMKRLLYLSGLFTLLLGFDDMFQFHEQIVPYLFGVSEKVVFAIYGILVISFLIKFYAILFKTDYILLLLAFSFLGLSVLMDVIPTPGLDPSLYENGSKMVGIVSWFFYFHSIADITVSDQKSFN